MWQRPAVDVVAFLVVETFSETCRAVDVERQRAIAPRASWICIVNEPGTRFPRERAQDGLWVQNGRRRRITSDNQARKECGAGEKKQMLVFAVSHWIVR